MQETYGGNINFGELENESMDLWSFCIFSFRKVHKHAFPVAKGQLKITLKLAELINPTITSSDVYYTIPHISWNTKCRMHNIEWPTQDLQAAVSIYYVVL